MGNDQDKVFKVGCRVGKEIQMYEIVGKSFQQAMENVAVNINGAKPILALVQPIWEPTEKQLA